jgi:DNA-binding transcriptional regulator YiaG
MNPTPQQIKQARLTAGLTQQATADLLSVSIKTVQSWEGGWRKIRPPTWRLFNLLTDALQKKIHSAHIAKNPTDRTKP